MMALLRPALEGVGAVAATRPPARRTAVRTDRTARARGEARGRAKRGAWELPPQRDVGRRQLLLCGA